MKKNAFIKTVSAVLALLLFSVGFAGCKENKEEKLPEAEAKYYEMATGLPDAMFVDAAAVNGILNVLLITDNGYEYFTKNETGYASKPISATVALEAEGHVPYELTIAPEGGVYLLCAEVDSTGVSLWYSSDLEGYELVADGEKLCPSEEDVPMDFTALGDGLVAGNYYNSQTTSVFNRKTGDVHVISGVNSISRCGDYLMVCNNYDGGIRKIDPETFEETAITTDFLSQAVCNNPEGGVYIASNGSLFSGSIDGTMWLKLFSYKGMSMGRSDAFIKKLFTLGDDIYIIYFDASYLPNLAAITYGVPETVEGGGISGTLRVWSLVEEAAVNEAIMRLKKTNPALTVEYTTAFTNEDDRSIAPDDAIRALNASLLAGDGPDVIITDYLNVNFYVKSGLLTDISGIVDPLIASGELFGNIVDGVRDGKELYSLPTSFGLMGNVGDSRLCDYDSLLELVEEYEKTGETKMLMGGANRLNEPIGYFLPLYYDRIVQNGKVNEEELRDFLEGLKKIAELCEWNADNEAVGYIFDSMSEHSRMRFDYGSRMSHANILQLMYKNSMVAPMEFDKIGLVEIALSEQGKGGDLKVLDNLYVPHCSVAVTSCATNLDAANEFIRTIALREVGSVEIPDGFTISRAVLEDMLNEHYKNEQGQASVSSDSGNYFYSVLSEEDSKWLLKTAESLKTPVYMDILLQRIFIDGAQDYFEGSESLDDCVKSLSSMLNTYLSEN